MTLWGTQAEEFDGSTQPVVAIKGGRISEFGGAKSISLVSSSVLNINPDIGEAHKLRGWFDCLTDDANFNSISTRTGGADGMTEFIFNNLYVVGGWGNYSSSSYGVLPDTTSHLYEGHSESKVW